MYLYIHELIHQCDEEPSYLHFYYNDTEHELENCLRLADKMDICVLEKVVKILEVNQCARFFKVLKYISNLENFTIHIKSYTNLDQMLPYG